MTTSQERPQGQIIFASVNSNAARKAESEENDNADQGVIW